MHEIDIKDSNHKIDSLIDIAWLECLAEWRNWTASRAQPYIKPIVFPNGDLKHEGPLPLDSGLQAIEQSDHGTSLSNAHGAESSWQRRRKNMTDKNWYKHGLLSGTPRSN